MGGWRPAHLRHALGTLRFARHPARVVYESIGDDFFAALAPGWLNLGLWEGPGDEAEAPAAARRLVEAVAQSLPRDGDLLDVGNGLGVQDVVIAGELAPRRLVALNVTEFQLRAGRDNLRDAGALPVVGDAVRLPFASETFDGVISVEAAFHFSSRQRFLDEVHRVLRPGGRLSFSDIVAQRMPRDPLALVAGLLTLRFWGVRTSALASAEEVERWARAAGFRDVEVEFRSGEVIDPALRFVERRLSRAAGVPRAQVGFGRVMLSASRLLRRRGLLEYVLVRAVRADDERLVTIDPNS